MASVDLYGADAGRIRNQYRTSIGRDASEDEVSGWLTGSYGGGGVDQWLNQIDTSGEAQERRKTVGQPNPDVNTTLTPGLWQTHPQSGVSTPSSWQPDPAGFGRNNTPGYQDLDYWAKRGVGYGQIFNTQTGQPNTGWARTDKGYERTGTNSDGPQGGDYQSWFMSLAGNGPSSPEALAALEPELSKRGIRLQKDSAGTIRGRMYMPDGTAIDVVPPEGWGRPWTWINRGTGGGHGTGGGAIGSGINLPGNQYSDDYTRLLEEMTKARIAMLQQPFNDPYRQQYIDAMQRRAQQLGDLAEPQYQRMIKYLEDRFNDLKGGGYTGAEHEVLRTQALDPLERDRQAARKRITERMAAAGHTMESGPMQMALQEVDQAFDEMRASTQGVLATTELQRREGRNQRAEMLAGALNGIPNARANEQLDVFSALESLEGLMRQEEESRAREAIGYSGMLADLGPQRLQLASQLAGMGGNYQPLSNTLLSMAQFNQNAALLNQQQRASRLNAVGGALYYLSRAGQSGGL